MLLAALIPFKVQRYVLYLDCLNNGIQPLARIQAEKLVAVLLTRLGTLIKRVVSALAPTSRFSGAKN